MDEIAREIIKKNIYMTLATYGGSPWAAPLHYGVDNDFNFYFISQLDSLHVKSLIQNPEVAFAIFDSTQEEGKGNGVQGSRKAKLLENDEEILEALKWYHSTYVSMTQETFKEPNPYRMQMLIRESK